MGVALTSLAIILARILDVSLGTLRTIFIVQGRRFIAAGLGFVELLIWILVVSEVLQNLDNRIYVLSYAGGFALGTYVGIRIEAWLAPGRQVLRVLTRKGEGMARELRSRGYALTEFVGKGMEGPVDLLLLEASRRRLLEVLPLVAKLDDAAIMLVDDVRVFPANRAGPASRRFWSHLVKKK